ncbi:MAG: M56 family metallopeptidase [Gammaproteobacteria bacterium]
MINQLLHNLCNASLCSTIFALIFITLRKLIIKSVGARWNYYLWFIIFIPWIAVWLPISFPSNKTLNLHQLTNALDIQQKLQYIHFTSINSLPIMIFTIWLLGTIIYSMVILFKHFSFIFLLKENSCLLTIDQQNIIKKALVNKNLMPLQRIYLSTEIVSPLICHIFKSKVYLPINFLHDYTSDEQKYVLQHECVHYHRCDLIANTAMLILICLNWFNPIILFSYRYFRSAQELSCDAILSQQYSSSEKKSYGCALLKASFNELSHASMSCWWNSGDQLKERCAMLKFHQSKPIKNFVGLIILLILASIAIAAPNIDKYKSGMKISNSSKNPLTFSTENNCLDEIGVIDAHSVKVISQENITEACQKNPTHCKMFVYATPNCSGKPIITLVIDVTGWGVMSIQPPWLPSYPVGANGFNLFFDGPWN